MRPVTITTQGALGKSSIREANERLVHTMILRGRGIGRKQISRQSGLSASAVTMIVERLMKQGLVREEPVEGHSGLGRRPTALRVVPESRLAIGVEITPFEGTVALADLEGHIVEQRVTEASQDPVRFLGAVHEGVRELATVAAERLLGVGVSITGVVEPGTGRVLAAPNLHWHNVDAIPVLRGGLNTRFAWDNNSNLSALAERWFDLSASKRLDNFVFVTLRSGLGTGVMVDGRLVQGATHRAGEFGHMVLYPDGRPCVCGNRGCWEEYASDRALYRRYRDAGGDPKLGSLDIASAAAAGDRRAGEAMDETARDLGLGLVNIIMGLNPSAIVLDDFAAAGWARTRATVWDVLRERVRDYWLSGVDVFPSAHAAHSSLAGAVALVLHRYFTHVTGD